MAGNILYEIKNYGAEIVKVLGRAIIIIMQIFLGIINVLFLISGTVLKMFLAVLLIGKRK